MAEFRAGVRHDQVTGHRQGVSEAEGGDRRQAWLGWGSYSRQRSLAELEQLREASRSCEKGMPLGLREYVWNFFCGNRAEAVPHAFPSWLCRPQDGKVLGVFSRAQEFEETVTFLCLLLMLIQNKIKSKQNWSDHF